MLKMTRTKELWDGNENLGMAYSDGRVNLFEGYEYLRREIESFVATELAKPKPEVAPMPEPTWFEKEYDDELGYDIP
jgi:hypothetical protein